MSTPNPEFWRGKRVLVTGHTGFKGSWLSLWLQDLGAEVHGLALDASTTPSLFEEARVAAGMTSTIGDIRDHDVVETAVAEAQPQIILHLAAQPLVRASYADPLGTFATNVMGTAHVLEAARRTTTVKAVLAITTDKVYENSEWVWGYRESDPLGGHDPYSASKGAAEIVAASYRRSFLAEAGISLATARAGNVIGGGDWSADRLVPDILRSFERGQRVKVRNPDSTRPWQHVLESLSGYLLLAERLFTDGAAVAEAWNFGPADADAMPVHRIVEEVAGLWGGDAGVDIDSADHPHEAHYLKLDISKAGARLGWTPTWTVKEALAEVVSWHRSWLRGEDMRHVCVDQIRRFGNS